MSCGSCEVLNAMGMYPNPCQWCRKYSEEQQESREERMNRPQAPLNKEEIQLLAIDGYVDKINRALTRESPHGEKNSKSIILASGQEVFIPMSTLPSGEILEALQTFYKDMDMSFKILDERSLEGGGKRRGVLLKFNSTQKWVNAKGEVVQNVANFTPLLYTDRRFQLSEPTPFTIPVMYEGRAGKLVVSSERGKTTGLQVCLSFESDGNDVKNYIDTCIRV